MTKQGFGIDQIGLTQAYTNIQDEGIPVQQQNTLNFIGNFVTAANDPVNNRTNITFNENGIDHGLLAGLGDDDHIQYLLANGTRGLTANWNAGSYNITARQFIGWGIVPIGSIIAFLKSYTNTPSLPDGYVECNGQVLSDADSVYNGQTIPNLNGSGATKRFLRGSSSSGGTGGSDTHRHYFSFCGDTCGAFGTTTVQTGVNKTVNSTSHDHSIEIDGYSNYCSTIAVPYYEVVWVMRVK